MEEYFFFGDISGNNNLYRQKRIDAGHSVGSVDAEFIIKNLKHAGGVITESIKVVAHSMGAAYAKGLITAIIEYAKAHPIECAGLSITEYDFAAYQQKDLKAIPGVTLYQFDSNFGDWIVTDGPGSAHGKEKGAKMAKNDVNPKGGHSIIDFINIISNLPEGDYKYVDGYVVKQ